MLFEPGFAEGLIGCEAFEGLESAAEVVGYHEVGEVLPQPVVIVLVVALDGRFLDSPVHSHNLAIGPRMSRLGEPVIDIVLGACQLEPVGAEQLAGSNRQPNVW